MLIVLLAVISGLLLAPYRSWAADLVMDPSAEELRARIAYFEAHPELQRSGTGWKQTMRISEYIERHGGSPPPLDRRLATCEAVELLKAAPGDQFVSSWFSFGPASMAGRMDDLKFHPANALIAYAATASGGIWKTTDGGATWAPMTDSQPTLGGGAVAVYPLDPNIVLWGTGEPYGPVKGVGVLRSTNGGLTWSTTSMSVPITSYHGFHAMEANPISGVILAAATDGLWRSSDAGATWTRIIQPGPIYDVKWKPGSAVRAYFCRGSATQGNGIYVSNNGGVSWGPSGLGQPPSADFGLSKLAVTPAAPASVYSYVVYSCGGSGDCGKLLGLYVSTNDGRNWSRRDTDPSFNTSTITYGTYCMTLAVHPTNPNVVWAGSVLLNGSMDGGVNWPIHLNGTTIHVDHHAIEYEPTGGTLWVGSDGGFWKTAEGTTWIPRNDGLVTYQFYDVCVAQTNPTTDFGGTQDNGTNKRTGPTWANLGVHGDGGQCAIDPSDENWIYASGNKSDVGWDISRSTDGGMTWTSARPALMHLNAQIALDPTDRNRLFTSTLSPRKIYRSTNAGDTWTTVLDTASTDIAVSPVNPSTVWTVLSQSAWISSNGGTTWTPTSTYGFPIATGASAVAADPANANAAVVGFGGYGSNARVARTTNRGATWTNVTGDLIPDLPVNAIAIDPMLTTHWYLGTDVGVWRSTNGGVNWVPFGSGLPNVETTSLEIQRSARKLVAGSFGRGAWEIGLPVVSPEERGSAPIADAMRANAHAALLFDPVVPNPFTKSARFRYAARGALPVSLDVYDATGRLVAHIAEARGDAIIRTVEWTPAGVPAGTYFAVLKAGDQRETRKIVLAR